MTLGLLIAAWVQDPSAVETFKALVKRIEGAESLKVRFSARWEQTRPGEATAHVSTLTGILAIRRDGKVRYEQSGEGGPLCVFDGTRLRIRRNPQAVEDRGTPTGVKPVLQSLFIRGGTDDCRSALSWGQFERLAGMDHDARAKLRDLRTGPGDPGPGLTFTFVPMHADEPAHVSLWYDPKSLQLKKRSFTQDLGDLGKFVVTETYEDIQLDGDLPDGLFAWPPQ